MSVLLKIITNCRKLLKSDNISSYVLSTISDDYANIAVSFSQKHKELVVPVTLTITRVAGKDEVKIEGGN